MPRWRRTRRCRHDQEAARGPVPRSFGALRRPLRLHLFRAQREGFRRYPEGLLLPAERNKILTALANTEPVAGAQRKEAQSLRWFLSESGWDPQEVNERRLGLLLEDRSTAPNGEGVLVIDEHGDRKWGEHTAHVGGQWLANVGKTENGAVSVSSLWAGESVYWPVEGGEGDLDARNAALDKGAHDLQRGLSRPAAHHGRQPQLSDPLHRPATLRDPSPH